MELVETLADALAIEALAAAENTGDEKLTDKISEVIGASSPTLQEAFLTAVRIRRADRRARELLAEFKERISKTVKTEPSGKS